MVKGETYVRVRERSCRVDTWEGNDMGDEGNT
jgi:hypothetical protein